MAPDDADTLGGDIGDNFTDSSPDSPCTSCGASGPGGNPFSNLFHKLQEDVGAPSGRLAVIADEVNPDGGGNNCGFIIDAVKARLTGEDPGAVAPVIFDDFGREQSDGSWGDIEDRFNTKFQDNYGFEDAFQTVSDGGPGTMGLISIKRPDGSSHVVMIANNEGTVAIVEGQGGGSITDNAGDADSTYNSSGKNNIGFAPLPDKFK